jgi:ABC-2 type transport system ATP-binding protein
MRQKLGVAMAVLSEPDLMVLDEPTTGLDPVSRLELWSFIARAAREGRAVVVSTTYLDETVRGDVVLALDEGRALARGTIDQIIQSMPGSLYQSAVKIGRYSWRRGRSWRVWSPHQPEPSLGSRITPDLTDVVTVAALNSEPK